jgi:3-methyladenine DNA glycosylase/8-oxoguanine DNA glycosylase
MHWNHRPNGVRFVNLGSLSKPRVGVTVYGTRKESKRTADSFLEELAYRFEWDADYGPFYKMGSSDPLLASAVRRLLGMRGFCAEDLYELLMIVILLQNAPVRRTEAMTRAMLANHGDLLEFGGQRHYCFWPPERLIKVREKELRALKVGYRAKSFLRASRDCRRLDERTMRTMDDEILRKTLLGIYSVGPASVDYLMQGAFHRKAAFDMVSPWETKIFSRILFNKPWVGPKRVLGELIRRYGNWRGLAAHYLFMDLAWKHKKNHVDWFGKLMPY